MKPRVYAAFRKTLPAIRQTREAGGQEIPTCMFLLHRTAVSGSEKGEMRAHFPTMHENHRRRVRERGYSAPAPWRTGDGSADLREGGSSWRRPAPIQSILKMPAGEPGAATEPRGRWIHVGGRGHKGAMESLYFGPEEVEEEWDNEST